jgi:hypothetical protein
MVEPEGINDHTVDAQSSHGARCFHKKDDQP